MDLQYYFFQGYISELIHINISLFEVSVTPEQLISAAQDFSTFQWKNSQFCLLVTWSSCFGM